jgi:hypothetical protein
MYTVLVSLDPGRSGAGPQVNLGWPEGCGPGSRGASIVTQAPGNNYQNRDPPIGLLNWQTDLLNQLDKSGPDAQSAAEFIRKRRIKVGFRKASPWVGAFWFADGNIYLNATRYSPDTGVTNPRVLCLVVHEAHHLKQGPLTALSVYGELEAWQVDFRLYSRLTNSAPNGPLVELLSLPVSWDRSMLRQARLLMQAFAGNGYRADLLPLYPAHKEIAWWITRRMPG